MEEKEKKKIRGGRERKGEKEKRGKKWKKKYEYFSISWLKCKE
jgi:hypothetical protein